MARKTMEDDWAQSIGACGACPNAAAGGCSKVNEWMRIAGLDPEKAQQALTRRVESQQTDTLDITGKATG